LTESAVRQGDGPGAGCAIIVGTRLTKERAMATKLAIELTYCVE
jgi:hypothetical protein